MQENFPDFETTEDGALIVDLQDIQYPEGINFNDAVIELSDILRAQLGKQGLEEGVGYEFDTTENRDFLVKFTDEKSETELMAILTNLHLQGRIPTIARRLIPDNRLKLGLDLKGGVHLVLEVDLEESKNELLRERITSIPDRMRERDKDILCRKEDLRVVEQEDGPKGLEVIVGIPSRFRSDESQKLEYLEKVENILNEEEFFEDAEEVSQTDTQGIYRIYLSESGIEKYSEQAIEQVLIVLRNRVDAFGVAEPSIRPEANRPRIIVELPGAKDSSKPLRIVKNHGAIRI